MDNTKYLVVLLFGVLVGLFLYDRFLVPDVKVVYKEKIVIDSAYKEYKERYLDDSLKNISLSDSIDFYKLKYKKALAKNNVILVPDTVFQDKPFEAPLRRYSGFKPTLHGNIGYKADVAGIMLGMELFSDSKILTVTNTITKETRTTIKSSGLYGTFGLRFGDQQLSPIIGATYVRDKSLYYYRYNIPTGTVLKVHEVGTGIKIFGK